MGADLTTSSVDRQNILNNGFALQEIGKAIQFQGVFFEGQIYFIKEQLVSFFEVDERTIERCLEQNKEELSRNGYEVLRGERLRILLSEVKKHFADDINVGSKITQLGVFNFRVFLNIAMLLTESDRAKTLRKMTLDIVIDVINQRTGGATKYINQRDEDFINSWFQEENYRAIFTDALRDYVDMGKIKYPIYTDKIYQSIFREKTQEYRQILKLHSKDKVRDTFYSEVLDLISSFEYGFADMLRIEADRIGRNLSPIETDALFKRFENQAHWKPLIEKARNKMASRDLAFRDALHLQLQEYITPLRAEEYERFLGDKSKELAERLEETKDVFKRLKERE